MAWQARFNGAQMRDGRVAWSVTYADGTSKVIREYVTDTLSDALIKATAIAEIARATEAAKVDIATLTAKPGQPIDLTPDAPPAEDPDPDPARTAFRAAYQQYQLEQRAIALGFPVKPTVAVEDLQAHWAPRFLSELT